MSISMTAMLTGLALSLAAMSGGSGATSTKAAENCCQSCTDCCGGNCADCCGDNCADCCGAGCCGGAAPAACCAG